MASSLALKRLVSSRVIPASSFLRPVATSPSSRLFNTNALRDYDGDHESDRLTDDRRSHRSLSRSRDGFLSGVFDPFSPTRSLSQETDDALNLRIDMPGLGKEDIKVSVEQNSLVIKGEAEKKSDDEENARRYSSRIDLPEKMYKIDEIKAEMKNGVLRVVVPKVKEEERANVFHVKVE
ncbi:hypothetical protein OIU77_027266 [Salix suchowensis]|uniref:SHSP domain-containing protein n=1 Tax=Salix suchowensis TaxID=1278906 RepID=A0ABQ9BSW5_9ROSI|nr:hypothetical protein OIU77_027266 [Salix suchowensis]